MLRGLDSSPGRFSLDRRAVGLDNRLGTGPSSRPPGANRADPPSRPRTRGQPARLDDFSTFSRHLLLTVSPRCVLFTTPPSWRCRSLTKREEASQEQRMWRPCGPTHSSKQAGVRGENPGVGDKQAYFESVRKATSNTSVRDLRPNCPFAGTGRTRRRAQVLCKRILVKGLILAQNERWRRGLGMQVERIPWGQPCGGSGERGSKAWVTCPGAWYSRPNGRVIPDDVVGRHLLATKAPAPRERLTWY